MNDKHVLIEVFDFCIYDQDDNLLFATDTVKSNSITHIRYQNTLVIRDVALDKKFFQDVMSGKYDGVNVKVKGTTSVRSLEDNVDRELRISINVGQVVSYEIESYALELSVPKISIRFPHRDNNGDVNFNVELKESDGETNE